MSAGSLRAIFMGTPDFAAAALRALLQSSHNIVGVYTQPPRPKGRGQHVQRSPVHQLALENNIPVFTPKNFKEAGDVTAFEALQADVAVVAAYGLILPQSILSAPKHGCINIHASLLPRWRGAAPIHRAILAGDEKSGISIMQMEAGLDTGPVISMEEVEILAQTTTGALHDQLAALGAGMIVKTLDQLSIDQKIISQSQPEEGVTYADKITKEEAKINWQDTAFDNDRKIRAFYPVPGAWCLSADGKRLKIIEATPFAEKGTPGEVLAGGAIACAQDSLQLKLVQPEGKKPMEIGAALNGGFLKIGERLL